MRLGPALVAVAVTAVAGLAPAPGPARAATCGDYPNQAAAQRAADTRDADGDGVYCESLPCPCSKAGGRAPAKPSCTRPRDVQDIVFSAARYPHIRAHFLSAVARGWPRILVVHRRKTAFRRDRVLDGYPPRKGYDRDEYPPAIGRATWPADIAYVPSRENRSHGAALGAKLRRFCRGTRFRYVFS